MTLTASDLSTYLSKGWQARLDLRFAKCIDRTALVQREHFGPLTVQRPFYPEESVCHVYLLHPPGGVVGGDELRIKIAAESDSHALLTTPAAAKFYRSETFWAEQTVEINIADNAAIEWLPQESIIYQGARLKTKMNLNISGTGRFIGWELFTLGRPASGEGFDAGKIDLNWHIADYNRLLLVERLRLDQGAFKAKWGLQNFAACGTLFAKPIGRDLLNAVQRLIGDAPYRGATLIDNLLVCRALDQRFDRLRAQFEEIYALIRSGVLDKKICMPRIWAT